MVRAGSGVCLREKAQQTAARARQGERKEGGQEEIHRAIKRDEQSGRERGKRERV